MSFPFYQHDRLVPPRGGEPFDSPRLIFRPLVLQGDGRNLKRSGYTIRLCHRKIQCGDLSRKRRHMSGQRYCRLAIHAEGFSLEVGTRR